MSNPSLMHSLHEPYRRHLATLADVCHVAAIMNRVATQRQWWQGDLAWSCDFGRFFPGEAPYATLVFVASLSPATGQAICVVNAYEAQPKASQIDAEVVHDRTLGWLMVTRFPADAKLPAIATVLAQAANPWVVRYRPAKRCTIRFDGGAGQETLFAKLFPDKRGQMLHHEAEALYHASLRGEIDVAVPRSLRWDAETGALWQSRVAGSAVLEKLLSAGGAQLAEKMGRAAASLPYSALRPRSTFSRLDQWRDTLKQGKEVCRRVPWLAGAVQQLLREVARHYALAEERPLRPIHAAPHAHQWLIEGEQLGLVDFDGFTLGDPELDVATFISEIDYEKPAFVAGADLNLAFLRGYEAVTGPLDYPLLQAYCCQKRLSKALKYAYAIHPEGDMRAEQATGRALISALSDLSLRDLGLKIAEEAVKEVATGEMV